MVSGRGIGCAPAGPSSRTVGASAGASSEGAATTGGTGWPTAGSLADAPTPGRPGRIGSMIRAAGPSLGADPDVRTCAGIAGPAGSAAGRPAVDRLGRIEGATRPVGVPAADVPPSRLRNG